MKLEINFMIKDGKKIISRDTKGYKVLLNRLTKEFTKIKNNGVVSVDVIIQTGQQSANNVSGKNYRKRGTCHFKQRQIVVWTHNCDLNHDVVLAVLAHEFGHLYDYNKDAKAFLKSTSYKQETFADKFSLRVSKKHKTPSITGKVRSIAAMNRSR